MDEAVAPRDRADQATELAQQTDNVRDQVRKVRSRLEILAHHVLGRGQSQEGGSEPEPEPNGLFAGLERRATETFEDLIAIDACLSYMEREFGLNQIEKASERAHDVFLTHPQQGIRLKASMQHIIPETPGTL